MENGFIIICPKMECIIKCKKGIGLIPIPFSLYKIIVEIKV